MVSSHCGDGATAWIGTASSPRSAGAGHALCRCRSRRRAPAELPALGDLLRATQKIGDFTREGLTVKRLSHHITNAAFARERAARAVGSCCEEEHRNVGERRARLTRSKTSTPFKPGRL